MRYYYLLLFFLSLCGKLDAQLIYSDSTELRSIAPNVLIYEDVDRELNAEEVFALPENVFARSEKNVPNFKHTKSQYWLRVDLENTTEQTLYLLINNPEFQNISTYVKDQNDQVTKTISGTQTIHSTRHLQTSDYTFSLGKRPKTLLIQLVSNSNFFIPAYVAATPALVYERHYVDLFNGAFLGIMVAMMLYNLFILFTTRDKIYLYYVLHISVSFIMMLRFRGIGFDLLWPNMPSLNAGSSLFLCFTIITSILFSTNFLETKRYTPKLHKFIWTMAITAGFLIITSLLDIQPFTVIAVQSTAGILTLTLFFSSFYIYFLGNRVAKYYILAWSTLLISNIVLILTLNGVLEISFFTVGAFQIGSALEAILLSNALADKINTYKTEQEASQEKLFKKTLENERLIKEQNIILEKKVNARTKELMEEKAKTDELLLNILPKPIAEELKIYGKATPRLHTQVSVMFIDIQEFTQYSEEVTPEELVEDIDRLFRGFDKIVKRHKVEKIKTIGDAYLCAAGLHQESLESAIDILRAAKDIIDFVNEEQNKGKFFNVRVGIHCGSVVAGVVGESKFAYDIWGDTVNVAARMEQNSEIGKINVSEDFYSLVKDKAKFEHRGKIAAKNKGKIDMYFCKS